MLFLLLRLLTAPTTLFPAAVVVDTATRPHAAVVDTATRARGGVDEMQRLTDPSGVSPGDREHALRRLTIIAERTREVEGAARLCLDDELSSISATKYDTWVPSAVQERGDGTRPPPPIYPCTAPCLVVPVP